MKLFVRTDGSVEIGTGHVFRTLVLADKLQSSGHEVTYLCRGLPEQLRKRIKDVGCAIIDIHEDIPFESEGTFVAEAIEKEKPDWVIVDHYDIKEDYYLRLKQTGVKLFAIDDINHTSFPVDILFNQNSNASELDYHCRDDTVKLLGPRYALVKDVYRKKRNEANIRDTLRRVLVFMGGADPHNQTLKVLKGLALFKHDIAVDVVLGSAFQYRDAVEDEINVRSLHCTIHQDIDDLADLMLGADLAFGGGGSSSWEMATMKLPMILMPIAENQIGVAQGLDKTGAAMNLGWFKDVHEDDIAYALSKITSNTLKQMSNNAAALCDGSGVDAVIEAINQSFVSRV